MTQLATKLAAKEYRGIGAETLAELVNDSTNIFIRTFSQDSPNGGHYIETTAEFVRDWIRIANRNRREFGEPPIRFDASHRPGWTLFIN